MRRPSVAVTACLVSLLLATVSVGPSFAGQPEPEVLLVDHYLSHISTAPSIKGEPVMLYLRERLRADVNSSSAPLDGKVVLFVHGSALGGTGAFDAPYQDYSWMAYLAHNGYDTFSLDLTGFGFSTRPAPMDNPCNLDRTLQAELMPSLQVETCPAGQPTQVTTLRSDWDDVDAAVSFIRTLRHVERVSLVGWSYGGGRIGGYATLHPDRVDRLIMLSPAYNRDHPDASAPEAPAAGPPMFLQTPAGVPSFWDRQVQCADQFDPGIRDALWNEGLIADGVNWAPGLRRVPSFATWQWNRSIASNVLAPTLVVEGEFDSMSPDTTPESIQAAYADLGSSRKVFVDLACSSHFAIWETRHLALFQASLEWLRSGSVAGTSAGTVRLGD